MPVLYLRLSDAEHAALKGAAELSHLSTASYARHHLLQLAESAVTRAQAETARIAKASAPPAPRGKPKRTIEEWLQLGERNLHPRTNLPMGAFPSGQLRFRRVLEHYPQLEHDEEAHRLCELDYRTMHGHWPKFPDWPKLHNYATITR